MNRKLKAMLTIPINSEIKFSKMKISTIYKIKKVLASLLINTNKIHLKKLFSLLKRSIKNNIKVRSILRAKQKTHRKKINLKGNKIIL